MRIPYPIFRWMYQRRLSRHRLRGTWLHSRLGDRLLDKALWRPTRESMARAWLIGFPVTMIPFLPVPSVLAVAVAIFIRANLLLCIALQFLSTPLTAPLQLPACYMIGEIMRGGDPAAIWHATWREPADMFSGDAVLSLYLGATVLGVTGGLLGYALVRHGRPYPVPRPPRTAPRALPSSQP